MSKHHRQAVLIGPVITTPPGAVPPVIIAKPHLVAQPLQYPLQPTEYPTYYEVPFQFPEPGWTDPDPDDSRNSYHPRFFPAPIPPLFPPVYGPFPPLFPPVPPPFYPYPGPPVVFPIIF